TMKLDGLCWPVGTVRIRSLSTALAVLIILIAASVICEAQQIPATETVAHKAFLQKLVLAAIERTHHSVRYVSSYVRIPYPGGDVPADTGASTKEFFRFCRLSD